jgi:hypothetical protein
MVSIIFSYSRRYNPYLKLGKTSALSPIVLIGISGVSDTADSGSAGSQTPLIQDLLGLRHR